MSVVPLKRTRPETCLSDYAFDRLLGDELSPPEERELRKHLFGCVECTSRLEALRAGRETFLKEVGPPRLALITPLRAEPRPPRAKRRMWNLAAGAMAAGAVLFSVMLAVPENGGDVLRRKGSSRLGFFVKHESAVRRGANQEIVHPGDALRFTYTLDEPRHLAILAVDAAKKVSVYYPEGQVTEALPSGREVALPLAALLDETLGEETIYGLFCERALAVEEARAAFERGERAAPSGCELERMTIEKR
jgi:hypothetical protein